MVKAEFVRFWSFERLRAGITNTGDQLNGKFNQMTLTLRQFFGTFLQTCTNSEVNDSHFSYKLGTVIYDFLRIKINNSKETP